MFSTKKCKSLPKKILAIDIKRNDTKCKSSKPKNVNQRLKNSRYWPENIQVIYQRKCKFSTKTCKASIKENTCSQSKSANDCPKKMEINDIKRNDKKCKSSNTKNTRQRLKNRVGTNSLKSTPNDRFF